MLNVSAKDKGTGKEQSIRIEQSSGLSDEEVEKMKNAAEEHAEEDKKVRERIETLNKADSLLFSTKKQLDENKEKISEENQTKIQEALDKLEELHKEEKVDEIEMRLKNSTTHGLPLHRRSIKPPLTNSRPVQKARLEPVPKTAQLMQKAAKKTTLLMPTSKS